METKYKIHFSYIISILLVIIILLLAVKWSENDDLIKYISFASTIASLLLAVLAIVYAYLSNSTFSKNITLINEVSSDLKSNTDNLSRISEAIEKDIRKLPGALEGVDKKVGELPKLIVELSKKDDKKKVEVNNASDTELKIGTVDDFLDASSYNGLLALYGISTAATNKIPISIDNFCEHLNIEPEYANGYVIASSSIGLFNYASSKGTWNITAINKDFSENVKGSLIKRGKEIAQEFSDFEYTEDIKAVENYFNE